jgi:hypothetical protein
MSLSTIRAQIKAEIQTIITSNIGTVYDYRRYCNELSVYKDLFIRGSKVNTWEIERESFSRIEHGGSGGIEVPTHNFIIRGFYAVDDSLGSDKVFQDSYVEPVCQEFMNNPTLSGVCDIINMPIIGNIMIKSLGNVLCHVVEIHLSVTERRIF